MKCPSCKKEEVKVYRALIEGLGYREMYAVDETGAVYKSYICQGCGVMFSDVPANKIKQEVAAEDVVH